MAANDPTLNHRVRVLFDWQYEGEETVEDEDTGQEIKMPKPIDDATEASPWLIFAAKGEGKPSTGRHVVASKVLVGFVDGNIERPYVMGYIQDKTTLDKTIDVDLDTDQGHYLRLSDGSRGAGLPSGLSAYLPSPSVYGWCSCRIVLCSGGFSPTCRAYPARRRSHPCRCRPR